MRQILFVDDEPMLLEALRRMLRGRRDVWEVRVALGGTAALEAMSSSPADVILTDMRMPGMDGAALLQEVAARWPASIRVVLSGQTDNAAALRAIPVAHQFLMKPIDVTELCEVIDRTLALRDFLDQPALRDLAGRVDRLPAVPGIYLALGRALSSSASSIADIAAIIERDPALTAKLLQLVNSAFFGQRREVGSVGQACALLGTGLIRNLALAHDVFSADTWRGSDPSWLEAEGAHAVAVAGIARAMQRDSRLAEVAVAAGLLHDIGKMIISTPAAAETHAEIGAYLLGLWGLPHVVVEAVAHHHAPHRVGPRVGAVLAAVHLADGLVHEAHDGIAREFDAVCLRTITGDEGREGLDRWREMAQAGMA